ncbi:hypothetical protein XENOCAPTIV_000164 [Xenoophorus captivus]|uniref:guanylate cyclase n=1 Tax=Xenoophorus captivus TaxID=1517983 RepID=A0ABV0RPI8_9TELE
MISKKLRSATNCFARSKGNRALFYFKPPCFPSPYTWDKNETPGRHIRSSWKITHRNFTITCDVSTGVSGVVEMDELGDREMDFAVWDMTDLDSGEFQLVSVYKGGIKQLVLKEGLNFQWPGGSPPPDLPECGLKNDNPACLTRTVTMNQMVAIVMCFVFIIFVTITIFIYRKLKLENELVAQLWRVSWEDIQMSNLEKSMRRTCSRLTMSLKGSNYGSLMTMEGNFQIYTKTGYYKGNLAAIKYISKKRIELTRKVLFELKHMRDVHNEHLTRFIGACLDPSNMCIITEYCPRGSLQDLMESDGITLDWMFRYSLITDIVKVTTWVEINESAAGRVE